MITNDSWLREFDRITRQMLGDGVWTGSHTAVPMDAVRIGDEFVLRFDLPGVDPGSIELTVERNVLTVGATRTEEETEAEVAVLRERPQGRMSRRVFLADVLDGSAAKASYDAGVLTVRLPLREQDRPRRIEVSTADAVARGVEHQVIEAQPTGAQPTGAHASS